MVEGFALLQALVRGSGLGALVILASALVLRSAKNARQRSALLSGVFVIAVAASMLEPLPLPSGVTLGFRGILIALAVPFAGVPGGLLTAAAASALRHWQGGPAEWAGIIASWLGTFGGIAFWAFRGRGEVQPRELPWLGLITSLSAFSLLVLPVHSQDVFGHLLPVIVCWHVLGTTLLGSLLIVILRQVRSFEDTQLAATTDPLTGLANRRKFDAALAFELRTSKRRDVPVSLLLIDVDHLKRINDTFGHQIGDKKLQEVAGVLRGVLRSTDIPARLGGDEFAVLLPNCGDDQAYSVAERIRARLVSGAMELPTCSVSVGIASSSGERLLDGASLLAAADAALYTSKADGRNRIRAGRHTGALEPAQKSKFPRAAH